jgi:hypothetical protein
MRFTKFATAQRRLRGAVQIEDCCRCHLSASV